MKIRYKVENNLIVGQDMSFLSPECYETDDNLQCFHESGAPLYKLDKGVHKLRTQAELEADDKYKAWMNKPTLAKMQEIDTLSIAEIRKYIAGLIQAPQAIKDLEAQYQTEAAKIK